MSRGDEETRVSASINPIENGFEVRGHANKNLRFKNSVKAEYGGGIRYEYANGDVVYAFPTLDEALAKVAEAMEEAKVLAEKDSARIMALMN